MSEEPVLSAARSRDVRMVTAWPDADAASDIVNEVIAAEMRLLSPEVRTSPGGAGKLLHPEFTEIGKSGRRWDRASMLAALPKMTGAAPEDDVQVTKMVGTALSPDIVHLTYMTEALGVRARRSSLWLRSEDGSWRIFHHQGTPVPSRTGRT